jgi:hypothetical protein
MKDQAEEFYQGLLFIGISHQNKDVRAFALVLLRSEIVC